MKLIIESGSSKTLWAFVQDAGVQVAETNGINPTTQPGQHFHFDANFPKPLFHTVTRTFFYGAGVNTPETVTAVKNKLSAAGIQGHAEVFSDMTGAARAACLHEEGLVCILGTGSNLCYYDGQQVFGHTPALGYVLGDEGSGFALGRAVLQSFFYKTMPPALMEKFMHQYNVYIEDVLENVYKKPGGNAYTASFAGFLSQVEGTWRNNLLEKTFEEFVVNKILTHPKTGHVPLHFTGSVAYYFQDVLLRVLQKFDLKADSIFQNPLEKLIIYHAED